MRALFVVGVRGPISRVGGVEAVILPLHRLNEAGHPRRDGTLLLLGPDVLDRIPPVRIRALLFHPYGVAVALPASASGPSLRSWNDSGVEVLPPGAARDRRLEALCSLATRVALQPNDWIPSGLEKDPILQHAVGVIPRLRKIDVVNWTAELGRERHFLGPRCRRTLGLEPHELCKRYVTIYCWIERSRRVPWGHLAAALGYPNASNLRAAVGARDWPATPKWPPAPSAPPDPPRAPPVPPSEAPGPP